MSSFSNQFNSNTNFGSASYTLSNGTTITLNKAISDYKTNCIDTYNVKRCVDASRNIAQVYQSIKTAINTPANEVISKQDDLKTKLEKIHSDTGMLALQSSDYMSVIMSSVLWTTLAGGLVAYLVIKSNSK